MTTADVPGGDAGRDLYGLAPDEFTAARNSLAKQLRAAGDKAEAALVAKLRRPPATAWALNRVARERPAVIEGVVEAGKTLRAATEKALAGDASSLRTAQAVERQAVEGATAVAAGFLADAGLGAGDGPRQRMVGTLRAAMVDETVEAALRTGVLDDDRDAPGFGLDAFSAAAAGSATRRRAPGRAGARPAAAGDDGTTDADGSPKDAAPPAGDTDAGPAEEGADAADEAAAQEAAAAERQEAARAAAVEARQRADRLAAAASQAERDAESARDAAAAARAEAEEAAARARRAAAAADAAGVAAGKARKEAADAAAEAERASQAVKRASEAGVKPRLAGLTMDEAVAGP